MIDELAINKRIRNLREHLGMGRGEFAEKTGLPKSVLINIEQEKQRAYAWHCESISAAFPEYAYWLGTGLEIPSAGQISPMTETTRQNLLKVG